MILKFFKFIDVWLWLFVTVVMLLRLELLAAGMALIVAWLCAYNATYIPPGRRKL